MAAVPSLQEREVAVRGPMDSCVAEPAQPWRSLRPQHAAGGAWRASSWSVARPISLGSPRLLSLLSAPFAQYLHSPASAVMRLACDASQSESGRTRRLLAPRPGDFPLLGSCRLATRRQTELRSRLAGATLYSPDCGSPSQRHRVWGRWMCLVGIRAVHLETRMIPHPGCSAH